MRWYLIKVFIFISVIISEAKYLFTYLLADCMYSLEKNVDSGPLPILIWFFFFFLLLSFMSYLYILNINPLSMIYNLKIFSPILFIKFSFCLFFILLCRSFSVLSHQICWFFKFCWLCFWYYIKIKKKEKENCCQYQCQRTFPECCLLGVL